MATPAMELRGITTGYGGRPVLSEASLVLEPGTSTGLLGRNGSGKTTLIHTALGLKAANAGSALLFGEPAWDAAQDIRARIGFVPQEFTAYAWLPAIDALELVGDCYPNWDHQHVQEKLREFLPEAWEQIGNLSPGQRQRVAALFATGHKPDLLLLDEPVAAMDPGGRREFFNMLSERGQKKQQTVLFSSHITSDIERFCSHIAILHRGEVLLHEPIAGLLQSICCIAAADAPADSLNYVVAQDAGKLWLRDAPESLLSSCSLEPTELEDLFLALTS